MRNLSLLFSFFYTLSAFAGASPVERCLQELQSSPVLSGDQTGAAQFRFLGLVNNERYYWDMQSATYYFLRENGSLRVCNDSRRCSEENSTRVQSIIARGLGRELTAIKSRLQALKSAAQGNAFGDLNILANRDACAVRGARLANYNLDLYFANAFLQTRCSMPPAAEPVSVFMCQARRQTMVSRLSRLEAQLRQAFCRFTGVLGQQLQETLVALIEAKAEIANDAHLDCQLQRVSR